MLGLAVGGGLLRLRSNIKDESNFHGREDATILGFGLHSGEKEPMNIRHDDVWRQAVGHIKCDVASWILAANKVFKGYASLAFG